ncbi:unnamed protein product [Taenia asiatica]|uniref:Ldh_1_C domain-containing protein n=1 Tax=Taenia asiatica TaxID=60517 RepID=A0A0R3W1R8_TAEAS|nr:unnamed protein product [Taenia asiatica]
MCYIAWRLSGFEKNRVFGIGTALESAAFRVGISQKLNHEGLLKNLPGIDRDIFMSLPCIVNANGVRGVMFEDVEEDEKEKLYASAKELEELILSINW